MQRSNLIIMSDDPVVIHRAQEFAHSIGVSCEVRSPNASGGLPSLSSGSNPLENRGGYENNIVAFPTAQAQGSGVSRINDLEAQAIENAIFAFKGNLTEAAKALGIGRATLYRKVKLYKIDPSMARKRKAA